MTTKEFERVALWMGWEKKGMCDGSFEWYCSNSGFKGCLDTKDSLTDSEAVEALNRLYAQGRGAVLRKSRHGWLECTIENTPQGVALCKGTGPTIAAAAEQALLKIA